MNGLDEVCRTFTCWRMGWHCLLYMGRGHDWWWWGWLAGAAGVRVALIVTQSRVGGPKQSIKLGGPMGTGGQGLGI